MTELREFESHPYVATIRIDPVEFDYFERLIFDSPELRLAGREIDQPDTWKLHIACASKSVMYGVEDRWG